MNTGAKKLALGLLAIYPIATRPVVHASEIILKNRRYIGLNLCFYANSALAYGPNA